jgi:hypothetical protein
MKTAFTSIMFLSLFLFFFTLSTSQIMRNTFIDFAPTVSTDVNLEKIPDYTTPSDPIAQVS